MLGRMIRNLILIGISATVALHLLQAFVFSKMMHH